MTVLQSIWDFISKQLLGMQWLNDFFGWAIESLFGATFAQSLWGLSIQFLFFDFIKISALLWILIFIISYIQSYFPPERTKKILSKYHGIGANALGALLGTLTPFCSCSSIPIFIGFTRAGLSSGITFSFLISSPLVDLGALVLLTSVFGWKVALAYVFVGLVLAIVGGTVIEKTGLGSHIEDFVKQGKSIDLDAPKMTFKDRLVYGKDQALTTYKKVVLYILIGVLIGAFIHNVIPDAWVQAVLGTQNPFSVLIATAIGVPMYADIFGTIPIAEALFASGVGLGTILSFMRAVTALSLPSLVMLRRVVKPKLLGAFFGIVVFGIIVIGYLFNLFGYLIV